MRAQQWWQQCSWVRGGAELGVHMKSNHQRVGGAGVKDLPVPPFPEIGGDGRNLDPLLPGGLFKKLVAANSYVTGR